MSAKRELRIGMIGHRFMGRVHSHAYRNVGTFFDVPFTPILQVIAGTNIQSVEQAAHTLGFKEAESDWHRLIERNDIDVIDIAAPNDMHAAIAIAASQAGKAVLCEKPLAINLSEAQTMYRTVVAHDTAHMICHNYRFVPAIQLAHDLIQEGRLGQIRQIRAHYLQDWMLDQPHRSSWRFSKSRSGSGALGDLGAHSIDLARFLVGEFSEVVSLLHQGIRDEVDSVDDSCMFLANFQNGATGIFEATRMSPGNRNSNRIEIDGDKGSLRWDLESMNLLQLYLHEDDEKMQGFRTIHCTSPVHPYASHYWPAGHSIGYETTFITLISQFLIGISHGRCQSPDFYDGYRNQLILDAVERSAVHHSWMTVPL